MKRLSALLLVATTAFTAFADGGETVDFNKARQLIEKQRAGEMLTKEEREYLERARAARAQQRDRRPDRAASVDRESPQPKESTGLVPLTDFTPQQNYKGQTGGLYGNGRNAPPEAHLAAAMRAASSIRPLDVKGNPDPKGKIVLISIGMSNTTQEYQTFQQLAANDREKSPQVVIVDGAHGGKDATQWSGLQPIRSDDPWEWVGEKLRQAGVSPAQVQAAWIKQALQVPERHGELPAHARELQKHLLGIVQELKEHFPNVRIAYLSSRIYAGYAAMRLNPEPYAYESAFSVRWLIEDQMAGKTELNYDPNRGTVKSPLLLWGPYLWADGEKGRKIDDLVYAREDLSPRDGTHPSASGRQKVARQLLAFFKTDPTTKLWFVPTGATR